MQDHAAQPWVKFVPVVFVLIWVAAVLTVWSMMYYLKKALPIIRAHGN